MVGNAPILHRTFIFKSGSRIQIVYQKRYEQWSASYESNWKAEGDVVIAVGISKVSARQAVRDLRLEKARKESPKLDQVVNKLQSQGDMGQYRIPDASEVKEGVQYGFKNSPITGTYRPFSPP